MLFKEIHKKICDPYAEQHQEQESLDKRLKKQQKKEEEEEEEEVVIRGGDQAAGLGTGA